MLITIILLISLFTVPWEIAFGTHGNIPDISGRSMFHYWLDIVFDFFFFIDMLITFKVAHITDDYMILDDKKDIAKVYLNSWFLVDFLSCIPYGAVGDVLFSKSVARTV